MELKSNAGLIEALGDIKAGKISSVYLVCGDENYIIKEAAQQLIEAILPEKDRETCLENIDGDKEDWDEIIQSLNTYPMFGSKNIIVVKDTKIFLSKVMVEKIIEKSMERFSINDINEAIRLFRVALGYLKVKDINDIDEKKSTGLPDLEKDPKGKAWLTRMVEECTNQGLSPIPYEDNSDKLNNILKVDKGGKGIPQNNVLILVAEVVDKRKKLYKTISDIGIVIDFYIQRMRRDSADVDVEEKGVLLQRAAELLKRSDKVFAKGSFEVLAGKTGYNVGIFINELGKVINSVKDRKKIEVEDIEKTVGRTKEDSIYDLQEAVGRRDFEGATLYLGELLEQGEFYLVLLQGIAREIWQLIAAKELIENELGKKWNPRMDEASFKKYIFFPVILKLKKEQESKEDSKYKNNRYNIYRLPSSVLMKLLKNSENYSKKELFNSIKLLAETDLNTKRTGIPPGHLLEKALMDICFNREGNKRVSNY